MILDLLKFTWHQLKVVELFISFLKNPSLSKSEFGAKCYAQNTKTWCAKNAAVDVYDAERLMTIGASDALKISPKVHSGSIESNAERSMPIGASDA